MDFNSAKASLLILLLSLTAFLPAAFPQVADCNRFCVTGIRDSVSQGRLYVDIFNGDTSLSHINYPRIAYVLNDQGDTIGDNGDLFFAHLKSQTQTYELDLKGVLTSTAAVLLVYSDLFGNRDTSCLLPYPCTISGIVGNKAASAFSVYPNPARDKISVVLREDKSIKTVLKLFNSLGQQLPVKEVSRTPELVTLDIQELSNGIFFLSAEAGDVRSVSKIAVSR